MSVLEWPLFAARTLFVLVMFPLGAASIRFTQTIAGWVFSRSPRWLNVAMQITKVHFFQLLAFVTATVNPMTILVTYKKSELPETTNFRVDAAGNLVSDLSANAIFISNHQIYTDWVFFWYLAYTARMAGSVFILLKESLKNVPMLGPGMVFFRFLFLLRKWDSDKLRLTNQLLRIDADARGMGPASGVSVVSAHSLNASQAAIVQWPNGSSASPANRFSYQLVIFPEGTVIAANTRARSEAYAAKINKPVFKHVLLPRARGLFLMLRLLRNTVDTVYDVALGFSGLSAEEYGENVFTLKSFYFKGKGPKRAHFYIRAFRLCDIPLGDDESIDIDSVDPAVFLQFEDWLYNVWGEKDLHMAYFFKHGTFHNDSDAAVQTVVADFKLRSWLEAFAPNVVLATFVLLAYLVVRLFRSA